MTSVPPTFTEADFRKSSRSEPDKECVHVARRAGWVEMRDSKSAFGAPADGRIILREQEGVAFIEAIKADRLGI